MSTADVIGEQEAPMLTVSGLCLRYGGVQAVTDMNLDVRRGQVHGLIGANGAGKTSFIDAITGFERPASGRVRLADAEITRWSPNRRVKHGLTRTFQNLELFSDLTVEGNLLASIRRSSETSDRVAEVSTALGLGDLLHRQVDSLTHGKQRMLTVARALMTGPAVLVLDEPAAGLESEEVDRLARVLRDVASRGTGVLLVDHDVEFVLGACDVITVMDFGRLIAHGTPSEIREDQRVRRAYLGEV